MGVVTPTGAVGYTLAAPIAPESYHIDRDAAGTAYAFEMDEQTQDHLGTLLERELTGMGVVAVTIEPGYLRVDAEPNLRTPLKDYTGAFATVVRQYNDRYADHPGETLQVDTNNKYVGVYRPDDVQPVSVFVERLDTDSYHDKPGYVGVDDPVFSWSREDIPENAAGGDGRHTAFEAVVQVDPETYAAPGGYTSESETFRWTPRDRDVRDPVAYMENRAGRLLGEWGSCTSVVLWPTHAHVRVLSGGTNITPRGVAMGARRRLSAFTPPGVVFEKRGRVLPLNPPAGDGVDAWLARNVPDVDGTSIDPDPGSDGGGSGGLLSSWRG